ncbi:hypothetical protein [Helcococcus kunzii]|uniref:hypothetical protein n=1 Tax=Helcococcus kunzii TaxID=40091 RepID=UPI0024ACE1A9|nr:hypothetical protein [Helcococcus kunzii]
MDGLKYSNLVIGLITLILTHYILGLFKKKKVIISFAIILILISITIFLELNEIVQIIIGSIFGATLINIFDDVTQNNNRLN